jgi:hypothetical protein
MSLAGTTAGHAQDSAMEVPAPDFITGESVMQRFDRLHRPDGFMIGAFQVNARLDLSLGYDTNIYDAHHHPQDDGFAVTGLGFQATTTQPDQFLNLDGQLNRITYFTQSSNNEWNGRIAATGWKDIGDNLRLNGDAIVGREIERRDDPQSSSETEPVLYWHYRAGSALQTEDAIITLLGGLSFDRVDYDNVQGTDGSIDLSERNMNEIDARTRATYNIASDRLIYIETIGNVRLPDDHTDTNDVQRQSAGLTATLGSDYAISPALRFTTAAGYRYQNYADNAVRDISGPYGSAQLIWSPQLTTEVVGQFAHDYYESFDGASPGYWLDSIGLTLTQEIKRDLVFVAQGSTGHRDFVNSGRNEHLYTFEASLRWSAAEGLVIALDNIYEHQTAKDSPGKFNSNVTLLHVTKTF